MKRLADSILLILLLLSCSAGQKETRQSDNTLIIPGKSAEGFTLNEAVSIADGAALIETEDLPEALSFLTGNNRVPFASFKNIIYMKNRYALFTNNGTITAIAGLSPANRVTDDAVKLTGGADSFIMSYGNSGLTMFKDGDHRIYIYKQTGIAIFDDNSDDSIDMYLIFPPEK